MEVHSPARQLSANLPDDASLDDRRMLGIYGMLCEIWCYCGGDKDSFFVFWDVTSCSLIGIHRCFGEMHFTPEHAASYLGGQSCLWKPIFECKEASRFECRRKAKYRCIKCNIVLKLLTAFFFLRFCRGCAQCC